MQDRNHVFMRARAGSSEQWQQNFRNYNEKKQRNINIIEKPKVDSKRVSREWSKIYQRAELECLSQEYNFPWPEFSLSARAIMHMLQCDYDKTLKA